jgi:hypothetical protein
MGGGKAERVVVVVVVGRIVLQRAFGALGLAGC